MRVWEYLSALEVMLYEHNILGQQYPTTTRFKQSMSLDTLHMEAHLFFIRAV